MRGRFEKLLFWRLFLYLACLSLKGVDVPVKMSAAETDEDIAVLAEPTTPQSNEDSSQHDLQRRFHITTGAQVTDPGSFAALQTAYKDLEERYTVVEQDNSQLKANLRVVLKKQRQQLQREGSSLPNFAPSGSLKTRGPGPSADSGFGSSGDAAKVEEMSKNMRAKDKEHARELKTKDDEILAMQRETYKLQKVESDYQRRVEILESELEIAKRNASSGGAEDLERLRQANLALEEANEQLLKEKTNLEKQLKKSKRDFFGLNKDYGECQDQKQRAEELMQAKEKQLRAANKKLVETEQRLVQLQLDEPCVSPRKSQAAIAPSVRGSKTQIDDKVLLKALEGIRECKQKMDGLSRTTRKHRTIIKEITAAERLKPSGACGAGADLKTSYHPDDSDDDLGWPGTAEKSKVASGEDYFHKNRFTKDTDYRTDPLPDDECMLDDLYPIKNGPLDTYKSSESMSTLRRVPDGECELPKFTDIADLGTRIAQTRGQFSVSMMGQTVGQATDVEGEYELLREGRGSPRVCPTCQLSFPASMSNEDFQVHILECDPTEEVGIAAAAIVTTRDTDRVCPMCNAVYPAAIPQIEYEQHVMHHFDTDDGIQTDFVLP